MFMYDMSNVLGIKGNTCSSQEHTCIFIGCNDHNIHQLSQPELQSY